MIFRVFIMFFAFIASAFADVCAVDDAGNELCLPAPAQRIATLSPGATELMFSAGGGEKVVAVVEYSDYPPAALDLPSVGNNARLDLEALLALKPDLIITWVTGNPEAQVEQLRTLGLPVFAIEPRTFESVATAIERLAVLAGTRTKGFAEAERFRAGMNALSGQYADVKTLPVFYQVWGQPLMTINNEHLIGKALTLCGGKNVFGDVPRLVPRVSAEAVLQADPDALIAASAKGVRDDQLDQWQDYPGLSAVQKDNLVFVPASSISRPTPRMLEATTALCEKLEAARERL